MFRHPILIRQWNEENCSVFHSVGKFKLRILRTNFSALFQSSIGRAKDTEKSESIPSPFFSLCTRSFRILVTHFFSPRPSLLPSVILIEIFGSPPKNISGKNHDPPPLIKKQPQHPIYINFELPMKQSINYFIINSQSRPSVYLSTIQAVSQPVNQLNSQSISQSTIQSVNGQLALKNDFMM